MDHTNIVQAYSVDNEGDRYYIVMEYIDGRDLAQMVEKEGPLDFEQAVAYIRQAADGLSHGHERGIIHCDIKPSNLLVNDQNTVKIVDMGLARLTGRKHDKKQCKEKDDAVLGTVDYLAPEQALESSDFDHRADIYSLGCTLYFLLTGHPPFPEGTLPQRIMKHQTQEPKPISDERPTTSPSLIRICQKMMAKKPEDRYQTAQEVSEALAAWRPPPRRRTPAKSAAAVAKDASSASGDNGDATEDGGIPLIKVGPAEEKAANGNDTPSIKVAVATSPTVKNQAVKKGKPLADETDAKETKKGGFLQTKQQKIIAGVAAGVVGLLLLLGITIPLAIYAMGSDGPAADTTVADADLPAGAVVVGDVDEEVGGDLENLEEDLEGGAATKASMTEADEAADAEGQEDMPAAPVEGSEATSEPAAEEQPKPEPAVSEPAAEKPPAEKPKPEPPKPAPPKPTPKPKPAPKPTNPYAKLATAVNLPATDATEGFVLGELVLAANTPVQLELVGGDQAAKGNRKYSMEAEEGGKSWLVHLDTESRGSDTERRDVARIKLEESALKFAWLSDLSDAEAGCLSNCALNITAGGNKPYWLPLTKPKHVEPIAVKLDRGGAKAVISASNLPPDEVLRFEITGFDGPFPTTHEFKPAKTLKPKEKGTVTLSGKDLPKIILATSFNAKGRSVTFDASATYQIGNAPPQPFKGAMVKALIGQAMVAQQQLMKMADQARHAKDKHKQQGAELKLTEVADAIVQLNAVNDLVPKINETGQIQFRVYSEVGDKQIELITSAPDPEAMQSAAVPMPEEEPEEEVEPLSGQKGFFD